jgi:large subunit ribosomal protein L29
MNASELRSKPVDKLKTELLASLKELFSLRVQKGVGQTTPQPHLFRNVKKQIARIKTILREKEGS